MASPLHIKGIRKAFGKGDKAVEVLKIGSITVREAANTRVAVGDTVGMTVSGRHNNWFDRASGVRITSMDSSSLFVG